MTKFVRVASGYSAVSLPHGGTYNQGPLIELTDVQFASLPLETLNKLVVVSSSGRQGVAATPLVPTTTPPNANPDYISALIQQQMDLLGVPVFLVWDGADYQPTRSKATTTHSKTFIGPVDPKTLPGVNLNVRDQWINV